MGLGLVARGLGQGASGLAVCVCVKENVLSLLLSLELSSLGQAEQNPYMYCWSEVHSGREDLLEFFIWNNRSSASFHLSSSGQGHSKGREATYAMAQESYRYGTKGSLST